MTGTGKIEAPSLDAAHMGEGKRAVSRRYRYFVVFALMCVYTLNFLDRQLMSVLAEPIKRELLLSDTQLGLLTGLSFALFYATFAVPVAWLADRVNRVRVIAFSCAVWSLFSALCGLASSFGQLALARMGVGIGEAGGSPPSYAIIADYFEPHERGKALAIFSLGVPIGVTLGTAVGGGLASLYGWRTAFIAIGLPGVLIAGIIMLVVREPRRGQLDKQQVPNMALHKVILIFMRRPVLYLTAIASGFQGFVSYSISAWMPAYLMRDKGMTIGELAASYSLLVGISAAIGGIISGVLVDRLSWRYPSAYALVPGIAILIALPIFLFALFAPGQGTTLLAITAVNALYITYLAPGLAVIQNSVPASQRSTAAALFLLALNLIGLGCGPVYVGLVSDWAAGQFGGGGLRIGLAALAPMFLFAAAAQFLSGRALSREALEARRE